MAESRCVFITEICHPYQKLSSQRLLSEGQLWGWAPLNVRIFNVTSHLTPVSFIHREVKAANQFPSGTPDTSRKRNKTIKGDLQKQLKMGLCSWHKEKPYHWPKANQREGGIGDCFESQTHNLGVLCEWIICKSLNTQLDFCMSITDLWGWGGPMEVKWWVYFLNMMKSTATGHRSTNKS